MAGAGLGRRQALLLLAAGTAALPCLLAGCGAPAGGGPASPSSPPSLPARSSSPRPTGASSRTASSLRAAGGASASRDAGGNGAIGPGPADSAAHDHAAREQELLAALGVALDLRPSLDHGEKGAAFQRYIVLHDTDVDASGVQVVDAWDARGTGVAAHFVVDRDGSVTQCVGLDRIAHHAGYGDTGHNQLFGVEEDGRDDKGPGAGDFSQPLGPDYADYGMNSHSIGVELVHLGEPGEEYPSPQLEALDLLVEMVDEHYRAAGCADAGQIIDHKAWRTTNPDTSPEFATHLERYRSGRRHS